MLTKRQSYSLVIFLIMVGVVSLLLLRSSKDYSILPSTLPQNELWTIEYAEAMQKKAFNIGIPEVLNEDALLLLVKHAYQWDKNAMIQYAKIVENEHRIKPDYDTSLTAFLKKYSHELVDKNGKPLTTPTVLDTPYPAFMKALADLKYPAASRYMISKVLYSSGWDNTDPKSTGFKNVLTIENQKLLTFYINNAIEGGYRYYNLLADSILFETGAGYKDSNSLLLNKLTEHKTELSQLKLEEAISIYTTCAKNGSQYCMVRLVESNYYGLGSKQDYQKAYAWSQLVNETYNRYLNKIRVTGSAEDEETAQAVNIYNQDLVNQIKEQLTPEQIEQSQTLVEQFKQTIVTWDYETWQSKREPILPKP